MENRAEKTAAEIGIDDYHQRTKHLAQGYARGPETLDWDAQPDPFRHFQGCKTLALPLGASQLDITYAQLFDQAIPPRPLNIESLGLLLELSMALSAWKSYGPDRWSLRVNPSSGNLHPTECYLVLPPGDGLDAGVYHYHVYQHELEQRCRFADTAGTLDGQSLLIGLSSIHRRESWKYGERAYRYCQLDVGHALAALRYACALLGWQLTLLDEASDTQIQQLLGLGRDADFPKAERESPDLLLQIDVGTQAQSPLDISSYVEQAQNGHWQGKANRLTDDNFYQWPIIPQAERAAAKPQPPHSPPQGRKPGHPRIHHQEINMASLIRQRRSAQAFDGGTLSLEAFGHMLQALLDPALPLDVLPWQNRLHLILFVHRVDGLEPGLYALPRSESGRALLQQQLRDEFQWQAVKGLPLYRLLAGNGANAARALSCHQPIAADSAFAVMMLAEYEPWLAQGEWHYRQLHWEAGLLGQILYLEAEAAGVRGTGIGCFFDDEVHEQLGIQGKALQDIYHFTVGTPRIDNRLQTELPYGHLQNR